MFCPLDITTTVKSTAHDRYRQSQKQRYQSRNYSLVISSINLHHTRVHIERETVATYWLQLLTVSISNATTWIQLDQDVELPCVFCPHHLALHLRILLFQDK